MSPRRPVGRRRPVGDAAEQTPVLMVLQGPELGRCFPLERRCLVLGSAESADIRLDQPAVSPIHAELDATNGAVVLRDRDSRGGTFVNDRPVREVSLEHGDRIQIGRVLLGYFARDVARTCSDELTRLASRDGLTGLFNKRAFREQLELELRRCLRYGRELSVFVYGVDALDGIERRIGEAAIDALQVQVTGVVGEFLRRDDTHARYAEEAFAVILPETNQAQALLMAERLRGAVEQTEFVYGDQVLGVTISLGVATFEKDMENAEDFIAEIDKNLYQSTKAGRNRVIGVEGGVTRCD